MGPGSAAHHAAGIVVAVFTTKSGERRYAETSGHRTIQIASAGSLIAHGGG
jgi:hypothetical protein